MIKFSRTLQNDLGGFPEMLLLSKLLSPLPNRPLAGFSVQSEEFIVRPFWGVLDERLGDLSRTEVGVYIGGRRD
jgi:hypothetical protein